jgi:hypothetical protein
MLTKLNRKSIFYYTPLQNPASRRNVNLSGAQGDRKIDFEISLRMLTYPTLADRRQGNWRRTMGTSKYSGWGAIAGLSDNHL